MGKAVGKSVSLLLSAILVIISLNICVRAEQQAYSVDIAYLTKEVLPQTVTVTGDINTDAAVTPVLYNIQTGTSSPVIKNFVSGSEVIFTVPASVEPGDYEIRLASLAGDRSDSAGSYFLAGNVKIVAEEDVTVGGLSVKLTEGYQTEKIEISGTYTYFSSINTTVAIAAGDGNEVFPEILAVMGVSDISQKIVFVLPAGLSAGTYALRITAGTNVMDIPQGIVVSREAENPGTQNPSDDSGNPGNTGETPAAGTGDKAVNGDIGSILEDLVGELFGNEEQKDNGTPGGETAEDKQAAVDNALELLRESAGNVKDESSIDKMNEAMTAVIDSLGDGLDDGAGADALDAAAGTLDKALKVQSRLLDGVKDAAKAKEIAETAIEKASAVIEKTGSEAGKAREAMDALLGLVQRAADKQGKKDMELLEEGEKAIAMVSDTLAREIEASLGGILEAREKMEQKLVEKGIGSGLEAKVVLETQAAEKTLENIEAKIPGELLKKIDEKGVDKVRVNTGIASLEIPPDLIETAAGESVSIGVEKVKITGDIRNAMTDEQKALLDEGAAVIDIDICTVSGDGESRKVSKFNGRKLEVAIPYTLKQGEDPDGITVLYLSDDGKIVNMTGRYNPDTGEVVFSTNHLSRYMVKTLDVTYSDMGSHWAEAYVDALSAKGIISGSEGKFRPDDYITRAEFAKLAVAAAGLYDSSATSSFGDVPEGAWYDSFVASAAANGIVEGVGGNMFAPEGNIKRQDMAVMAVRALGGKAPASADGIVFDDGNDIAPYALEAVMKAVKTGCISGYPDNTFAPGNYATRAEAAAIIYRLFNYLY